MSVNINKVAVMTEVKRAVKQMAPFLSDDNPLASGRQGNSFLPTNLYKSMNVVGEVPFRGERFDSAILKASSRVFFSVDPSRLSLLDRQFPMDGNYNNGKHYLALCFKMSDVVFLGATLSLWTVEFVNSKRTVEKYLYPSHRNIDVKNFHQMVDVELKAKAIKDVVPVMFISADGLSVLVNTVDERDFIYNGKFKVKEIDLSYNNSFSYGRSLSINVTDVSFKMKPSFVKFIGRYLVELEQSMFMG